MKQLTQGEITAVARVLQNMKDSAAREAGASARMREATPRPNGGAGRSTR
ncbi:MAG: hypothetical protein ACLRNQ_07365 [Flavonifractor plautii]